MRLRGKCVVITGAARGLGRACAVESAKEGADLVLLDIGHELNGVGYSLGTMEQLERTAVLCREHGAAILARATDVREQDQIQASVEMALDRFGKIDALINNAGIVAPSGLVAHEISEPQWLLMLDVDLCGAWRMIKAVAPHMTARRSGSIVS